MRVFQMCFALLVFSGPQLAHSKGWSTSLVPLDGQSVRFEAGIENVTSVHANTSLVLTEPAEVFAKRAVFTIYLSNNGSVPFNLGTEHVTVNYGHSVEAPILTFEQLEKEEKRRQGWATFGAALAAGAEGLSAGSAGTSSGTANYSGNTYGNVGGYGYRSNTSGSMSYSQYDATAAAIARNNSDRRIDQVTSNLQERRVQGQQALQQNLRTTTIDPGRELGSKIAFELPAEAVRQRAPIEALISVNLGSEIHRFKAVMTYVR